MRGKAQPDGRLTVNGSKLSSHFSLFVGQSTQDKVTVWGRHCSVQRHFPIYDILLQFKNIGNKAAKSQILNLSFSGQNFRGMTPKFLSLWGHITWKGIQMISAILLHTRRYKPKYTKYVANFRTLIAKNLLGEDPSARRYALGRLDHPLPTVKFSGGNAP